jgi:formate hydrogenlyase subunit 6/NADH:ubiquinone oxidoreductase subunit I
MDLYELLTGPFALAVFGTVCLGILYRGFFFWRGFRADWGNERDFLPYAISILGRRWMLPTGQVVKKKPFFTANRYLFHICLLAAPLCSIGHVALLEESFLGWSWPTLPQIWLNGMSLVVVVFILWVQIKRIFGTKAGKNAQKTGYLLSGLVGVTFLTGSIAAGGWINYDTMLTLHILCSAALLFAATFLVCYSTADPDKCVGCAACAQSCPSEALVARDEGTNRDFVYSHHRCLYCSACVTSCPEKVVTLRHGVSLRAHSRRKATVDRSSELEPCIVCSTPFAAQAQLAQISEWSGGRDVDLENLKVCERCKKRKNATPFHQLLAEAADASRSV